MVAVSEWLWKADSTEQAACWHLEGMQVSFLLSYIHEHADRDTVAALRLKSSPQLLVAASTECTRS